MVLATPATAQDAGLDAWGRGGCSGCHGGLAEGGGGGGEQPAGPSLRATRLDRASLRETIACGRPGTAMPYNLKGAYTEAACWGLPIGGVPERTQGGAELSAAQIDAMVEFLVANVVGQTRITRQNCAVFFGGNTASPMCAAYR
jgi:mono/diheme cytochrome c family protein